MIADIDRVVRQSLASLVEDVSTNGWSGRRERELVSLFCFGYLVRCCVPGTFLNDAAQIGIEMAVPQITAQAKLAGRPNSKRTVCKDIVIWPEPRMSCWDAHGSPVIRPRAIIEWKHNAGKVSQFDVEWLRAFSSESEAFVGFAVSTNRVRGGTFSLACTRTHSGRTEPDWLSIH